MTNEAMEAKRIYNREYQRRNRQRINQRQREWRKNNPELVKAQLERYWQRKAEEMAAEAVLSNGEDRQT